jgi:hypothetical protein
MNRGSRHLVVLILFMTLPFILFAASPSSTQEDSADTQEGSAGGQADVPVAEEGEDGIVEHESPEPPGLTEEELAAEERVQRGAVEQTTKRIVFSEAEPPELQIPDTEHGPAPNSPTLDIPFQGTTDTGQIPPDPTIAAGPNNIVVAVNGVVNTFSKAGTLLASQTLAAFFAPLGQPATDGPFDPWLVFDPYISRFWLVAVSQNVAARRSALLIALSNSSDATAGWTFFALDARLNGNSNSGFWCDYPKVGVDAQAVIFTCNMFNFANDFQYAKIRVMTKDQFIDGTCTPNTGIGCRWWDFWNLREGFLNLFKSASVQPALMYNAELADGMFLINAGGRGGDGDELIVRRVTNARVCCIPGNQRAPDLQKESIEVGSFSKSPNATQQPGTTTRINTGTTRLLFAFWQAGTGLLSTGQNLACEGVACAGFTELDVDTYPRIRVVNDFAVTSPSLHLYYPHVAVNANGNKTMVFSASNATLFAGARYIGIPASSICTDCLDGPLVTIRAGQSSYVRLDNGMPPRNRWGDYSGASADPDGLGIWIHGEFAAATPNTWGTQVALTYRTHPRNDDIENAQVVPLGTPAFTQNTQFATVASVTYPIPDPLHSCTGRRDSKTVWFRFDATVNDMLTVDTFGSAYNTVLSAYDVTMPVLPLVELACNDDVGQISQSQITFPVIAGQSYFIEVSSWAGTIGGNLVLNVALGPPRPPPPPPPIPEGPDLAVVNGVCKAPLEAEGPGELEFRISNVGTEVSNSFLTPDIEQPYPAEI